MEEQIENIIQAQVEERQEQQQQIPIPAGRVPDAVIGRALTSGGNGQHSIEHIVAFFQKEPTGSAAATFMAEEFGEGGKGVKIAGQDYSLWFDSKGFRIAPGRSAFGPGNTLISWANAAATTSNLLRDGMFATQEKIDAAPENEVRELAEKLWYLRQAFSDSAEDRNFLPTISDHFLGKGFPEDTKEIAELLKKPASRQQIMRELDAFMHEYSYRTGLLRFHKNHDPLKLYNDIYYRFSVKKQYRAAAGFAPAKASFITEDEITQLLRRGSNISESKLRIYAHFMQGHDARECAVFLRNAYGEGGYIHGGYNESHGSKGIRFTRSDEESGYAGYHTVQLNWNQVQNRIRDLIDAGQYLNEQEKAYLPAYEKQTLARRIYGFYINDPNRTNPPGNDMDAAVKKIRTVLQSNDPEKKSELFQEMVNIMAAVSPDNPAYQRMTPVLRDMEAFQRGEYSLYAPLPEDVLQAERQAKQASKEKGRKATAKRTAAKAPDVPEGELAAAARALAKKMQKDTNMTEDEDGQISFDFWAAPVEEPQDQPVPTLNNGPSSESKQKYDPLDTENKETAAQYNLSYGFLGNGLTVWNLLEKEDGDYKTVAHIAPDRTVTFYAPNMPEEIQKQIQKTALTSDARISATQDTPVFSVPPRVLTQEQAAEYNAIKEAHPNTIVLYHTILQLKHLIIQERRVIL